MVVVELGINFVSLGFYQPPPLMLNHCDLVSDGSIALSDLYWPWRCEFCKMYRLGPPDLGYLI